MLKLREVFHVFIWHTFTSGKQTVDRNWQQNNAATYLDNFSLYTSWRCTSAVQRLGWNHPTLLDFQLNIFRKLTMVLHVPDIDNPGERDAVETLLAMRNSSRINHRDNASSYRKPRKPSNTRWRRGKRSSTNKKNEGWRHSWTCTQKDEVSEGYAHSGRNTSADDKVERF